MQICSNLMSKFTAVSRCVGVKSYSPRLLVLAPLMLDALGQSDDTRVHDVVTHRQLQSEHHYRHTSAVFMWIKFNLVHQRVLSLNRLSVFVAFRRVVLIFLPFNRLVNEMPGTFPVTSDVRILNTAYRVIGTGMEMVVDGVFSFNVIMFLLACHLL